MSAAHDGRAVANFVLDLCDKRNRAVSNLSLQKILFFCHTWHLIETGLPLIRHSFEAWEYGPVLQYVYHDFKRFGAETITERSTALDRRSGGHFVVREQFDDDTLILLEKVVDFYSRMSPSELVRLSHSPDGPWHRAWNHSGKANPGMQIADENILAFYSRVPSPYKTQ